MGLTRTRVRVEGIVQGVGFRPFVHALAGRLGLAGLVGNDPGGVFVEVEGPAETVERFLAAMAAEAPPLAVIERVTATTAPSRSRAAAPASGSPSAARPSRSSSARAGPQAGQHTGWAWNRRSAGSWYSRAQSAHMAKPAMVVAGRS